MRWMKIRIKLNLPSSELEIEEDNHQDLFEFLNNILDLIEDRKDILGIKSYPLTQKEETLGTTPISVNPPDIVPEIKGQPRTSPKSAPQEKIEQIAKDARLPAEKIARIFDFGTNLDIPPLNVEIKGNATTEKQRQGILLLMYINSVLNLQDKISSKQLKPFLEKSIIDPKNLFNAFPSGGTNQIKKEGQSYRITPEGKVAAKQLLKNLCDNIS